MSKPNEVLLAINTLPDTFTLDQIRAALDERDPEHGITAFGWIMNGLMKQGHIYRVSTGRYTKKKPKEPTKIKQKDEEGFNPLQIGEAVIDVVLSLKQKIENLETELKEAKKIYKERISSKEDTIRILNDKIREAKQVGEISSGRTLKLGDVARITKQ